MPAKKRVKSKPAKAAVHESRQDERAIKKGMFVAGTSQKSMWARQSLSKGDLLFCEGYKHEKIKSPCGHYILEISKKFQESTNGMFLEGSVCGAADRELEGWFDDNSDNVMFHLCKDKRHECASKPRGRDALVVHIDKRNTISSNDAEGFNWSIMPLDGSISPLSKSPLTANAPRSVAEYAESAPRNFPKGVLA